MFRKLWWRDALGGALVTAALLGLLLLGSQLTPLSFVPLDIADAIIRLTPGSLATAGIERLGPGAKLAVEASGSLLFLLVGALVGWAYGRVAPRRVALAGTLLALVPLALTLLVQLLAGGLRGGNTGLGLSALLYLAWGLTLAWFINRLALSSNSPAARDAERRTFLLRSGGALVTVALGSAAIARLAQRGGAAAEVAGAGQSLPTAAPARAPATATGAPTRPPPTPAVAAAANSAGVKPTSAPAAPPTPEPTPVPFVPAPGTRSPLNTNETLYVISSATRDPVVERDGWRLTVGGAVERPFSLSYDELLALPRVDQTSTLECISNEVGNYLIGTCVWNGVPLRDLLERAGVQEGVIDIKLIAAEGYTESIPLAKALEESTLVAYGIGGEALATKHGFPARLRVPGLYGEKNVKWLTQIEAVREDYQGYWQQRGWTDTAIIETTAVFDTANPFLGTAPPLQREGGVVPLGGIAFAGNRGISRVELRVDDGPWIDATLDPQDDPLTWRFWRYDWPAAPGKHTLTVRATDGTGALQTDEVRDPHPDGATGYHAITVEVV